ncbi:MAG: SDR family NAD(P)-dependent oxidoreductase [Hyphomicrobiales bacterium]|nr:SDR family NAD(P)-dependent oxidoreductase [Hyphomicrobiales bacterium]
MDINGQAAIVTGGASGLGEGTARMLAANGAKVAIFDMNQERGEAVAADIGGTFVHCDVSSGDSGEAAFAAARAAHGPARILVNCAGIAPPAKVVGKHGAQPLQAFASIINVNLIGSFNMIRLFCADAQQTDALPSGERGVIVSTASVAAFEGQIGQSAYAASKGGVIAMTLPIAREMARYGIRLLTIAPGIFLTPLLHTLPQEIQDSLAASVPFPSRLGRPDEFANLVKHMCENEMLNAEVVRLDGAIRMSAS